MLFDWVLKKYEADEPDNPAEAAVYWAKISEKYANQAIFWAKVSVVVWVVGIIVLVVSAIF